MEAEPFASACLADGINVIFLSDTEKAFDFIVAQEAIRDSLTFPEEFI